MNIKKFHEETLIIDLVCPLASKEEYVTDYRKGNVNIIGVTLAANDDCRKTMYTIASWFERFRRLEYLMHVKSVQDIKNAFAQNKLGVVFHLQNTNPLDDRIELIEVYYRLGLRIMQPTYNGKNLFGCGCEVEVDTGLTKEGYRLIKEMNKFGIVVDVSHAGYKTALNAIDASDQPLILSHSNAFALCDSARNIPDEIIKKIARKRGVIGINGFPAMVSRKMDQPSLDNLLDHIDYIRDLIGIDHISLGLDYYTGQSPYQETEKAIKDYNTYIEKGIWNARNYPKPPHKYPKNLETPDKMANLTYALFDRGYTEKDICKILGGNLVRVFSESWK